MTPPRDEANEARGIDQAFRRFFRREPRQSRSRAVVEAVVQATEDLLARGWGHDELTIEALSDRAGVAMGSLYEYFSGKDSVLGVLVGRVTRANFEALSRELVARDHATLEATVRDFAGAVVRTYVAHPRRMRALLDAIGRLGLLQVVTDERDRFAGAMAERARQFLPAEDAAQLAATMRVVADAVMGVLVGAALRSDAIDAEATAQELTGLAMHLIRARHPSAREPGAREPAA